MSVAFTSIVRNSDRSWTFSWSGSGTWHVVLYGILLATTEENSYRINLQEFADYPPPLEVVDEDDLALSEQHKPYVLVQWYREDGAARYHVQHSTDGVSYATIATTQESGQWVYTYHSPILDDGSTHYWKVIAESIIGNQSTARQYNASIISPPRPVDSEITIAYSAGNIVVTEA